MTALLLFPQIGTAGPWATADITFTSAIVFGRNISTSLFAGLQLERGDGNFSWQLAAQAITVNWTRQTYVEAGPPPSLQEPIVKSRRGTSYGEANFSAIQSNSAGRSIGSTLFVIDSRDTRFSTASANLRLEPAGSPQWQIAANTPSVENLPLLPPGNLQANMTAGTMRLRGNFSIYIWDSILTVEKPDGAETFNSGNWTESLGPGTGNQAARYHHFQRLRVEVTTGDLELNFDHKLQWRAKDAVVDGHFAAHFQNTLGVSRVGENETALATSDLAVSGNGTMRATNATTVPGRLRAELALNTGSLQRLATVTLPEIETAPTPQIRSPIVPKAHAEVGFAWLWSLLLLIPLAAFVTLRVEPWRPDITDVEWAVLTNRSRRARRWSRRLVRREPANPDAVFLYASTLLQAKQFQAVLDAVEPLAKKIPKPQRMGIAYTLAVAARLSGDAKRAHLWGKEAAREPELRRRMVQDNMWKDLHLGRIDDAIATAYV